MIAKLMTNKQVQGILKEVSQCGVNFKVNHDKDAGTLEIDHKALGSVLRGIQKGGAKQPWIVRFNEEVFVEG
jgi:hypothetical protein